MGISVFADYRELRLNAVNYIAPDMSRLTPRLNGLITNPVPRIKYGLYKVKFSYIIPGTSRANSTYDLQLFNSITD
jgi:hypothetical protein